MIVDQRVHDAFRNSDRDRVDISEGHILQKEIWENIEILVNVGEGENEISHWCCQVNVKSLAWSLHHTDIRESYGLEFHYDVMLVNFSGMLIFTHIKINNSDNYSLRYVVSSLSL